MCICQLSEMTGKVTIVATRHQVKFLFDEQRCSHTWVQWKLRCTNAKFKAFPLHKVCHGQFPALGITLRNMAGDMRGRRGEGNLQVALVGSITCQNESKTAH